MKRVLVVDDSSTTRALIVSTIEEMEGFETVEAPNGFEALKRIPQQPLDLIVTDINMPDINGLEIVHFVKHHPDYRPIDSHDHRLDRGQRRGRQTRAGSRSVGVCQKAVRTRTA
jgi:CheY-like chemotaxis protein